tara:strand:- start:12770 stop:13183 length:414 start_codon:yes stop_codon:yes gene_type:complete
VVGTGAAVVVPDVIECSLWTGFPWFLLVMLARRYGRFMIHHTTGAIHCVGEYAAVLVHVHRSIEAMAVVFSAFCLYLIPFFLIVPVFIVVKLVPHTLSPAFLVFVKVTKVRTWYALLACFIGLVKTRGACFGIRLCL